MRVERAAELVLFVLSSCAVAASEPPPSSSSNPATSGFESDAGVSSSEPEDESAATDMTPPRREHPNEGANDGSSGTDDSVCNEYAVHSRPVTPNILIVLDRSGSMAADDDDDGVNRWEGSIAGVKMLTAELDDVIRFGLMTFPSDDGCGTGSVDVDVVPLAGYAIASALDDMRPGGNTPTTASLEAAHSLLASAPLDPDAPPTASYVVLVTDGEPNCRPGDAAAISACGSSLACAQRVAAEAAAETVATIEAMARDGIKTYVLGYETQGLEVLDDMAAAGGTGDTRHRAVEGNAALLDEFRRIATKAVDCDFVLESAQSDPSRVLVELDGRQLNLGQADGWVLSPDGTRVTVQGTACESLQNGVERELSVKVLCEVVTPI